MRIFSYKIVRDYGFAPNPFHGVCTLATCKPKVRKAAQPGDIVIGCGSAENGLAGKIICVMRISGKCTFQEYWDNPRFEIKRPFFKGSKSRAYGDNIYHHDINGHWIQEKSHHSFEDGSVNGKNLLTDTGADSVLWGEDFVYFGLSAIPIPDHLRAFDGEDLYPSWRSHRSIFSDKFVAAVDAWYSAFHPRGCLGRPAAWK